MSTQQSICRGYATGTFDMISKKHMELLRMMKSRCDFLTIGLVSDKLAIKQKRIPLMTYDQRRALLENCKWVDEVVEHNGDTKQVAWSKLRFNRLFIGDDYYEREEYESMKKTHPEVELYYLPLPHPEYDHTSDMVNRLENRFLNNLSHLAVGICGPLMQYQSNDCHIVTKPIAVGAIEFVTQPKTCNAYNMPVPPPRNWKDPEFKQSQQVVNLAGVSTWREIFIHRNVIMKKPWNPVYDVKQVFEAHARYAHKKHPKTDDIWSHVNMDRSRPQAIYWLYQKYAGISLDSWVEKHCTEPDMKTKFKKIIDQVKVIVQELKELGVIHGDIHHYNVCIDEKNNKVNIIDFGWCMHHSFHMNTEEYAYYKKCLLDDFDWNHFMKSLDYAYSDNSWYQHVRLLLNEV